MLQHQVTRDTILIAYSALLLKHAYLQFVWFDSQKTVSESVVAATYRGSLFNT